MDFYYLPYSPWSLKAGFALRHHGIAVRRRLYTPILGAPGLRLRLRKLDGRLTVPVLFTPEGPITDSFEIALYADRAGHGSPLIPAEKRRVIEDWNAWSERALGFGRARAMVRAREDRAALVEALPEDLRARPWLANAVAQGGVRLFLRKYGIHDRDFAAHEQSLRQELGKLRGALGDGRKYLTGEFSYADVAVAIALQLLEPLPETPMGPATRAAATEPELLVAYDDLLRWRNTIHGEHPLVLSATT